MVYSDNFNLKIYQGTDKFNPLTFENENFNTIDDAMQTNLENSVPLATETVVGTVHSILRGNEDAVMFRYKAANDWNTDDTMTVDGVSVTVYTSAGTEVETGAIVRGTMVLGILDANIVTLMVTNPSAQTAQDSLKLEGHPASYFATSALMGSVDISPVKNTVTGAIGTTALTGLGDGSLSGAIKAVYDNNEASREATAKEVSTTGWTNNLGLYSQEISVTGMTEDYAPNIDVYHTPNIGQTNWESQKGAYDTWTKDGWVISSEGKITLYTYQQINDGFWIQVKF